MKIRYDAEVDALYIELRALAPGTAECRELTPDITADYGPDGKLAGLEILDASQVLGEDRAQGGSGISAGAVGYHGLRQLSGSTAEPVGGKIDFREGRPHNTAGQVSSGTGKRTVPEGCDAIRYRLRGIRHPLDLGSGRC